MTHRWLKRCIAQMEKTNGMYDYSQTLFPIVQGSVYKDLRKESAEFIASVEAEGNAIGGLSVGEPEDKLYEMTELVCEYLPTDKPRYLMGVGTPWNIIESIALGIDMMDCVLPTRNARHGTIYTQQGVVNIKNQKWEKDYSVLDPDGTSYVDKTYTRAYVRHLFKANESLAMQITSIHNLAFYLWLVGEARNQIELGTFNEWKNKMVPQLKTKL